MAIHKSTLVARARPRPPASLWLYGTTILGLVLATSSLMLPRAATAQVVRGIVVDAHGDTPIMIVEVSILDDGGEVIRTTTSDRNGDFMIGTDQPGEYRLRAERLGYESVTTEPLEFRRDSIIEVVVRMAAEAIVLDPLEVIGRGESEINRATFEGLYQRRATAHSVGGNRVWVRTDPEMDDVLTVREFVRQNVPNLRCGPILLFRGTTVDPDFARPLLQELWTWPVHELEGIEVYRRFASAPPDLRPVGPYPATCSAVVIWPRRMGDEPW